jgi:ABC-2 type transport system ATP-binding protein
VLSSTVEAIPDRYLQLTVGPDGVSRARELHPFYEREVFGRTALFYEGRTARELEPLGEVRTPSIADLFVAKMQSPDMIRAAPAATGTAPDRTQRVREGSG